MTTPDQLTQARQLTQAGRLPEARRLTESVCREQAGNADAWLLLGNLCVHLQDYARAEECLQQVITLLPDNTMAHYQLAATLKASGKLDTAIRAYRKTLELDPGLARVHNDLGVALQEKGRLNDATNAYQQAVDLQPDYALALYNLGSIRREQGDLDAATTAYRKALAIKADFPEVLNALGVVLQTQEDYESAAEQYRAALALAPQMEEAHFNLGKTLKELDQTEAAQAALLKSVDINPGRAEAWFVLGNTYSSQKNLGQAISCYLRASALKDNYEQAISAQADILELMGDFESAWNIIEPLVTAGSENLSVAINYAALGKRFNRREEAIALLEKILSGGKALKNEGRMQLHFSLGRLNDSAGHFDQAFSHYEQGNRLKHTEFDHEQNRVLFDTLISTFSKKHMPYLPRSGNSTSRPVFILGMPRSGTTLVEQIISSHPDVYGAGELTTVTDLTTSLPDELHTDSRYPACIPLLGTDNIIQLARTYLDRLPQESQTAARVTDKMPHNFLHLGLIELMFPGAHIIHCRRDPRDNCVSMYFSDFASQHDYCYDLSTLGWYYREYERLMTYWRSVIKLPIYEVQYEGLVANQKEISRELVKFCGLEWDERCIDFHKSERAVHTASYEQVRNPMYSRSVARWKNYEKYIGPLIKALENHDKQA